MRSFIISDLSNAPYIKVQKITIRLLLDLDHLEPELQIPGLSSL
jgi:hypothetical protein